MEANESHDPTGCEWEVNDDELLIQFQRDSYAEFYLDKANDR